MGTAAASGAWVECSRWSDLWPQLRHPENVRVSEGVVDVGGGNCWEGWRWSFIIAELNDTEQGPNGCGHMSQCRGRSCTLSLTLASIKTGGVRWWISKIQAWFGQGQLSLIIHSENEYSNERLVFTLVISSYIWSSIYIKLIIFLKFFCSRYHGYSCSISGVGFKVWRIQTNPHLRMIWNLTNEKRFLNIWYKHI